MLPLIIVFAHDSYSCFYKYRDLKLENFLFSDETAESELKMIDFGLSKVSVLLV